MRIVRALPQVMLWVLILATATVIAAVCSGIIHGEDGIDLRTTAPRGAKATPGAVATPGPASNASLKAESDDGANLPGRFVPTQGRQHTSAYPLDKHIEFCPEHQISNDCYASNPPTSGMHLPVQAAVLLENRHTIKIPPDPGVYDFDIPRESVPHIEEHAGVYVGYHCVSDDCTKTAERLRNLVTQEISLGARVVMSSDPDLDEDTIGIAAWTRADDFASADYTNERVRTFIKAHSCRFDPELFCKQTPVN